LVFRKKEREFFKQFKNELDQITHKQPNPTASWIAKQHYLQKKLELFCLYILVEWHVI